MGYEEYDGIDSKELIQMALVEDNEDKYWDYIGTVRLRGEKEIFELTAGMCNSKKDKERATAVRILSQLMIKKKEKDELGLSVYEMPYREETLDIFYNTLETEVSPDVIGAILCGIGHAQEHDDYRNQDKIIKYKFHTDPDVRFGLAIALQGREDDQSVSTLIELMDDPDDEVRNWSTFGIGSQIENDIPEIRDALWKRVNDEHGETRWEAINGLAERKDERVFPFILMEIENGNPIVLVFDAAIALGDPRFIEPLKKLLLDVQGEEDLDGYWVNCLKEAIEKLEEPE